MRDPNRSESSKTGVRLLATIGVVLLSVLGLGLLAVIPLDPDGLSYETLAPHRPARVAVIALSANGRINRNIGPEHELWHEAARLAHLDSEDVEVQALSEILRERFGSWVLPRQTVLSDEDLDALDAFLASGGGVVLSGNAGTVDDHGELRLIPPHERFFPGYRFEIVPKTRPTLQVGLRGPLVANLAPGRFFQVEPAHRALVARGDRGALFWSSDAGEPPDVPLLHGHHLHAPVVWLGLAPETIEDGNLSRVLLRNALVYTARRPLIELQTWPNGRAAAALISSEPATDKKAALLIRQIHRTHEVPLVDASKLRGCSAEGLDDEEVVNELSLRGCLFVASQSARSSAPEIPAILGSKVVLLPLLESTADDEDVSDPRSLIRRELNEYLRVERLGGLYSLTYDPAWIADPDGVEVIERLIGELAAHEVWFASGDELARWWLSRRKIRVDLALDQPGIASLSLRNDGGTTVRGVTVRVYLPPGSTRTRPMEPSLLFGPRNTLRVASDRSWVELVAQRLDPGQEVSYTLTF